MSDPKPALAAPPVALADALDPNAPWNRRSPDLAGSDPQQEALINRAAPPVVAQEEEYRVYTEEDKVRINNELSIETLAARVSTLQARLCEVQDEAQENWQSVKSWKARAEAAEAQLHAVQQIVQKMALSSHGAIRLWHRKLQAALPKE